jgi:hypothetical protein
MKKRSASAGRFCAVTGCLGALDEDDPPTFESRSAYLKRGAEYLRSFTIFHESQLNIKQRLEDRDTSETKLEVPAELRGLAKKRLSKPNRRSPCAP